MGGGSEQIPGLDTCQMEKDAAENPCPGARAKRVELCGLGDVLEIWTALSPVGLAPWPGPWWSFPSPLAAGCGWPASIYMGVTQAARAGLHNCGPLLQRVQPLVPSHPPTLSACFYPSSPLCPAASQARPSWYSCVWPGWGLGASVSFLGGLGRQIQNACAERAQGQCWASPWPPLSPLSAGTYVVCAPVHVCCSRLPDGFICPHLHKKYHAPHPNEQAHLAVQAFSRLRAAWPGAVIIRLFPSRIKEGLSEQALDTAPAPELSTAGHSRLPGQLAVSSLRPSVCAVWVGPASPGLSSARPGLGHH